MSSRLPLLYDLPKLNREEFRLLGELVSQFCGIQLTENNRLRVERLLGPRVKTLGLSSFLDYCRYLSTEKNNKEEYFRLAEIVANNETYFFREEYQLKTFSEEILPLLAEKNRSRRRLSIWSAGCSSGEEAYTLAMLLLESGLFDESWDLRILGTDISARVLAKARKGTYGPSSFRTERATDPHILATYFQQTREGLSVTNRLRSLVTFARANLIDSGDLQVVPPVDVVFCRNVLIYFPTWQRRRVIETFHRKLKPGGFLLLGHSESLLTDSSKFDCLQLSADLAYRKPEQQNNRERRLVEQ